MDFTKKRKYEVICLEWSSWVHTCKTGDPLYSDTSPNSECSLQSPIICANRKSKPIGPEGSSSKSCTMKEEKIILIKIWTKVLSRKSCLNSSWPKCQFHFLFAKNFPIGNKAFSSCCCCCVNTVKHYLGEKSRMKKL